jgi:hypothetical protein
VRVIAHIFGEDVSRVHPARKVANLNRSVLDPLVDRVFTKFTALDIMLYYVHFTHTELLLHIILGEVISVTGRPE